MKIVDSKSYLHLGNDSIANRLPSQILSCMCANSLAHREIFGLVAAQLQHSIREGLGSKRSVDKKARYTVFHKLRNSEASRCNRRAAVVTSFADYEWLNVRRGRMNESKSICIKCF